MQRLGPYQLLQRIGAGGMAEIFLARRDGPGGIAKVVAVKRILPHLASFPDFVAMFLDEAQLAARLSHPHIAQIYDFGQADGTYYIAMEYVPGEDLLAIIRRARDLGISTPPGAGAAILAAACDALHHAHEQRDERGRPLGIVHRDVTPSNLIVSHEGVVKLVDFGIAKAERRLAVTAAGALKGKYAYMSPEHALGYTVDRRSDVFSLGIVAFELMTQRRLFHRESELAVLRAITEDPIPDAQSRRADLPDELNDILSRALERDVERRYPTAQAMQLDLADFLASRSTVSAADEVQAFMKRLWGAEDAARRRRQAAGELEDSGPGTDVLGRPPSAQPEELTLGGAGTPAGRARAASSSVFDAPPAVRLAAAAVVSPGVPATAVASGTPAGTPAGARAAAQNAAQDTDHLGVPDLRPRRRVGRALGVLLLLAAAGGGVWLALRPAASDAGDASDGADALTDQPPLQPPTASGGGPAALDAPRIDMHGRTIATAVARPDKRSDGATAWLTIDAPAQTQIALDGEPLGVAPLARRKVSAGLHTVLLTGPAPGFSNTFALDLAADSDHVEVIRVDPETGQVTRTQPDAKEPSP